MTLSKWLPLSLGFPITQAFMCRKGHEVEVSANTLRAAALGRGPVYQSSPRSADRRDILPELKEAV